MKTSRIFSWLLSATIPACSAVLLTAAPPVNNPYKTVAPSRLGGSAPAVRLNQGQSHAFNNANRNAIPATSYLTPGAAAGLQKSISPKGGGSQGSAGNANPAGIVMPPEKPDASKGQWQKGPNDAGTTAFSNPSISPKGATKSGPGKKAGAVGPESPASLVSSGAVVGSPRDPASKKAGAVGPESPAGLVSSGAVVGSPRDPASKKAGAVGPESPAALVGSGAVVGSPGKPQFANGTPGNPSAGKRRIESLQGVLGVEAVGDVQGAQALGNAFGAADDGAGARSDRLPSRGKSGYVGGAPNPFRPGRQGEASDANGGEKPTLYPDGRPSGPYGVVGGGAATLDPIGGPRNGDGSQDEPTLYPDPTGPTDTIGDAPPGSAAGSGAPSGGAAEELDRTTAGASPVVVEQSREGGDSQVMGSASGTKASQPNENAPGHVDLRGRGLSFAGTMRDKGNKPKHPLVSPVDPNGGVESLSPSRTRSPLAVKDWVTNPEGAQPAGGGGGGAARDPWRLAQPPRDGSGSPDASVTSGNVIPGVPGAPGGPSKGFGGKGGNPSQNR